MGKRHLESTSECKMEFCKNRTAKWSSSKRWKGKDNSIREPKSNSNGINKSWIHRRKKTLLRQSCLLKTMDPRCFISVLCVFTSEGCCHHGCLWVWAAGEEYLALGGFSCFSSNMSQFLVDSTSGTTECLLQTSVAGVAARTATSK